MSTELAKQAVACKHWRWMPGMRAIGDLFRYEGRVCAIVGACIELALDEREAECDDPYGWHDQAHSSIGGIQLDGVTRWNHLPDLTDPATLGCLLALVREAWEPRRGTDHIASTVHTSTGWGVGARVGSECFAAIILHAFASEAEALVAALEAAP